MRQRPAAPGMRQSQTARWLGTAIRTGTRAAMRRARVDEAGAA